MLLPLFAPEGEIVGKPFTELEGQRGHLIRGTQRQGWANMGGLCLPQLRVPRPRLLSASLEEVLVGWAPSRDSWHPVLAARWPWFKMPFLLGTKAALEGGEMELVL